MLDLFGVFDSEENSVKQKTDWIPLEAKEHIWRARKLSGMSTKYNNCYVCRSDINRLIRVQFPLCFAHNTLPKMIIQQEPGGIARPAPCAIQ